MQDSTMQDDRIIRESGVDARVAAIVRPVVEAVGYRLVRVRLLAQDDLTLQIMAERPDGSMTVEDCEEVSRAVSPALDVEDPIDSAYQLEVSSPGIDRPLVRLSDFQAAIGHLAKVETAVLVAGRKRFRGQIIACDAEKLTIDRDKVGEGEEARAVIPLDAIAEAKLVLTDALVREALKKDKEERRQRKKARRKGDDAGIETDE
ncbi:ribosome maturation factor RimP [Nitratireductor luteus]|uniref:ribosome maturation factor RimP n=1 Tax=Nitratireductor luteus TaxID=2976980 RepID=UPI003B84B4D3